MFIVFLTESESQLRSDFESAELFKLEDEEVLEKIVGNATMLTKLSKKISEKSKDFKGRILQKKTITPIYAILEDQSNPNEDDIFAVLRQSYLQIGSFIRTNVKGEDRKEGQRNVTRIELKSLLDEMSKATVSGDGFNRLSEIRKAFLANKVDYENFYSEFLKIRDELFGGFISEQFEKNVSLEAEISVRILGYEEWDSQRRKLDPVKIPDQVIALRSIVLNVYSSVKNRAFLAPILISKI